MPYQLFLGGDGRAFVLAVGTNALWQRLLQVLDLEKDLGSDRRFATNADRTNHRDVLVPLLQKQFALLPTATWVSRLMAANIPAAPIQTVGEALSDPQTLSRALVVEIEHPTLKTVRSIANPVRLENQPVVYRFPPPLLGEHNRQILGELGFPDAELEHALQTGCTSRKTSG